MFYMPRGFIGALDRSTSTIWIVWTIDETVRLDATHTEVVKLPTRHRAPVSIYRRCHAFAQFICIPPKIAS